MTIYLIIEKGKAYYSAYPSTTVNCWKVNNEIITPWLMSFPELFEPKTIH